LRAGFRHPAGTRGNYATTRRFRPDPAAYRSGLEVDVAEFLKEHGVSFRFEEIKLPFTEPAKNRHYTPDFVLRNGVVIETKGLFQTEDRQKHILVKAQHPDIDIRFVFQNAKAKIAKLSRTTYADWAEKNGFKWAHKSVPLSWAAEPVNELSLAALESLRLAVAASPKRRGIL